MNEPQVWTLIGVFAAGMCGMITIVATLFLHAVKTEFESVKTEFASVRTEMRLEFGSVRAEIVSVRSEIGAVHGRIDHLDRDVSAIYRHLFGLDRG